jgi:hypothetical protein
MRLIAARPMPRQAAQMGGLKKILRKAAGPILAVAAVASGNPQLAVPAFQAGKSAAGKKKAKLEAPVEPLPAPGWFDTLTTGDRNALMIGGAVVGTLLLSKVLAGGKR